MPKRIGRDKDYNDKLRKIGVLFQQKRYHILNGSRESFIENRNELIFNADENTDWISLRYLVNTETGKNLPSIEMLIKLAVALEVDPVDLFEEIYKILSNREE